ncbi:MAG: 3-hydroxyacyl-CoA dehydrogenase [Bdellovibrionota bacterium]
MQIKGKVFLVSGGASGLGAACVERFYEQGASVVLIDKNKEVGEALAKKLGGATRFVAADVSQEKDVQTAIDVAWNDFGNLHGAVCCAGVGTPCRIVDKTNTAHPLDLFSKIIQVNLVGTFNVIRLVASSIIKRGTEAGKERAVIISTASVAAFEGQIGQAAYSASKGGIVAMTLPIARELARFGIRVLTIAPGIFDTPMLAGLSEEVRASLGQQVPFPPRLGRPVEYAQLAQSIIENEMLNGEVIRIDGAIRMAAK